MSDSTRIVEFFECSCGGFLHTIRCSCYLPLDEDNEEDNVIYLDVHIIQTMDLLIPPLWDGFISTFRDDRERWSFFYKEFWKEYYRVSVWARLSVAFRYLCTQKDRDGGIFDCITISNDDDLHRLDQLLSQFAEDIQPCPNLQCEIEGDNHQFQFYIDKMGEGIPNSLSTQFQFKKYGFMKRLWKATKYALGSCNSCYGNIDEFLIDRKTAAQLRGLIKELQTMNREE